MMMSAFAASNSAMVTACDLSMNSAMDSYGRLYRVAQTGVRSEYCVRYSDFDLGFLYRAARIFGGGLVTVFCGDGPLDGPEKRVFDARIFDIVNC